MVTFNEEKKTRGIYRELQPCFITAWLQVCCCYVISSMCVCVPVDSSSCLVPRIVGDPDVTLMKLHSDWLVVSVVEEDSVVFSCRHLQHVFISTDI